MMTPETLVLLRLVFATYGLARVGSDPSFYGPFNALGAIRSRVKAYARSRGWAWLDTGIDCFTCWSPWAALAVCFALYGAELIDAPAPLRAALSLGVTVLAVMGAALWLARPAAAPAQNGAGMGGLLGALGNAQITSITPAGPSATPVAGAPCTTCGGAAPVLADSPPPTPQAVTTVHKGATFTAGVEVDDNDDDDAAARLRSL